MRIIAAIFAALLALLQYPLWLGKGSWSEVWRLDAQVQERRTENARLSQRNIALTEEVKDLEDGLDAVEERARAELGMIKRGELFVQVVPPAATQAPILAGTPTVPGTKLP